MGGGHDRHLSGRPKTRLPPLTLKEGTGSPYFRFEVPGARRKILKTEEMTTTVLKTSSTVDSISRCPGLYRMCVAIQVSCEALGTCTQLHRIVTGKQDSRATWNLPTGSRIPGSRRHRTALERVGCLLFVTQSTGDSWRVQKSVHRVMWWIAGRATVTINCNDLLHLYTIG